MDDGLKKLSEHTDVVSENLSHQPGDCAKHGRSERVLVRLGHAWTCPKCTEDAMAAELLAIRERERQVTLMAIARIPSKYAGQRFAATTPAMNAVRGTVRDFRNMMVKEKRWAVLVLMGAMGTGKTLLACELAESLVKNLSLQVRYVTAQGIISEIQASYSVEGKTEETEIEKFLTYDLLIIDEIDAKRSSDNATMLFNEVINRRYSADKPVVVITNQPFDSLAQFVGDRVDDRLHENAFVAAFNWPSFRRNPA